MNIEIKRLSPELTKDYIEYFDNIAFTDNNDWAGCYCIYYHWNDLLEAESKEYAASGGECFRRNLAIKFIQDGILQGYLAYEEGSVVGWCNANDKGNYDGFSKEKRPEIWENVDSTDKVKSIVCYTIAPHMRRKGVATQLLDRVCSDALAEGYAYVEAYPGKGESDIHRNYHGPYTLYERCGFSLSKELEGESIVRKYL
ncbi:MAG: GNAT family N-acetyltransferase [Mobilitalea sp.]